MAARLYRTLQGQTLEQVTEKLRRRYDVNIHPTTLWRWEGGSAPSSKAQVQALARVLKCSQRAFYHEPVITWKE